MRREVLIAREAIAWVRNREQARSDGFHAAKGVGRLGHQRPAIGGYHTKGVRAVFAELHEHGLAQEVPAKKHAVVIFKKPPLRLCGGRESACDGQDRPCVRSRSPVPAPPCRTLPPASNGRARKRRG